MMNTSTTKAVIESGKAMLGIEFGSTRIKAVLIDETHIPIASGSHEWENSLIDGIWTYSITEIIDGLQDCYRDLVRDVKEKFDAELKTLGAIGISAMMHGYMAFDKNDTLLVPFRTWRNTMTGPAADALTALFQYNIPQRWSISHLYQAILNGEAHLPQVTYFTTLAGYIHWKLTGRKVLGIDDASGMFPIDMTAKNYNQRMIAQFDELIADKGYAWKLEDILPKALCAGEDAGTLTPEGAALLDPSGVLQAGIPLCPPEGDAGTGMAATNSCAQRTGNVSAGTSIFSMVVLEKDLTQVYPEIDLVATPSGALVAMVHCNNCTSDLNAWVGLFKQALNAFGVQPDMNDLYGTLYRKALEGDSDCGGLLAYNYYSGEGVTHLDEGRPLFARLPDSKFNLANFMRVNLYAAMSTLKIGMDLLRKEQVQVDRMMGHGGLFKTKGVGQKMMADAMNAPVYVMETAGEGGAWGIALLAAYMAHKAEGQTLEDYLGTNVFAGDVGEKMDPTPEDVAGFDRYTARYSAGLAIEAAAVEHLH